jgi:hypothetical protein
MVSFLPYEDSLNWGIITGTRRRFDFRQRWLGVMEAQRLPDIVTVEEAGRLFCATQMLSYRVFSSPSTALVYVSARGSRLQVGEINAVRQRVHIRKQESLGLLA